VGVRAQAPIRPHLPTANYELTRLADRERERPDFTVPDKGIKSGLEAYPTLLDKRNRVDA